MYGSLNLEYFFLVFYNAATGVEYTSLPTTFFTLIGLLQGVGIFFSLLFLAGLVYLHLRHEQLHHEHEHAAVPHGHDAHGSGAHGHNEHEAPAGAVRWDHVMTLMTQPHESSWRGAIIEADILLDELLADMRLPGDTMAEKFKNANRTQFTTLDLAGEAHGVRNRIAHSGSSYELTEREARRTIDLYRQVFDEFGYI